MADNAAAISGTGKAQAQADTTRRAKRAKLVANLSLFAMTLPGLIALFVFQIDWPSLLRVYALFGVIYLLALVVLVRSLVRMRLFDAIKMGEAV